MPMSKQPDMDNRVLSVRIPRPDYRRLQKLADQSGRGFNQFLRSILRDATDGVQLTAEDYNIIKKEMERDIEKELTKGKRVKRG
jgi:predicted DNA-binding protein